MAPPHIHTFIAEPNQNSIKTFHEKTVKTELREKEQLETATKKVKNDKNTFHKQEQTYKNTPKRNDNRVQHRSTDKSYGTTSRQ